MEKMSRTEAGVTMGVIVMCLHLGMEVPSEYISKLPAAHLVWKEVKREKVIAAIRRQPFF